MRELTCDCVCTRVDQITRVCSVLQMVVPIFIVRLQRMLLLGIRTSGYFNERISGYLISIVTIV